MSTGCAGCLGHDEGDHREGARRWRSTHASRSCRDRSLARRWRSAVPRQEVDHELSNQCGEQQHCGPGVAGWISGATKTATGPTANHELPGASRRRAAAMSAPQTSGTRASARATITATGHECDRHGEQQWHECQLDRDREAQRSVEPHPGSEDQHHDAEDGGQRYDRCLAAVASTAGRPRARSLRRQRLSAKMLTRGHARALLGAGYPRAAPALRDLDRRDITRTSSTVRATVPERPAGLGQIEGRPTGVQSAFLALSVRSYAERRM